MVDNYQTEFQLHLSTQINTSRAISKTQEMKRIRNLDFRMVKFAADLSQAYDCIHRRDVLDAIERRIQEFP